MAPNHATFDFRELSFANETTPNKQGGKGVSVGYGAGKERVHFQLGDAKEALRCPWGLDRPNDPTEKAYFKLELTEETQTFVQNLESAVLGAAEANSVAWFKKALSPVVLDSRFTSNIKPSTKEDKPDCVKIKVVETGKDATVVQVRHRKGHKLTKAVAGTVDDIKAGDVIVPVVRIQSGVWFMSDGKTFGISLVAASLLVIKEGAVASSSDTLSIDLGDVEMTDASDDEGE